MPDETEFFDTTLPKAIPKFKARFYVPIKKIIRQLSDAFEQHGDVIQITGFPARVFVFRNPEHVSHIYRHQAGQTKNMKIMPRVKWVYRKGGYALTGGKLWRERRMQVYEAFKSPFLNRYAAQVPELTKRMLDRWSIFENKEFDICREFQILITQLSFKMFFSKDISDRDLEAAHYCTYFIDANMVRPFTPLWLPLPQNFRFRRCTHQLRKIMLGIIQERRTESGNKKEDLLSILINLKDTDTGEPWSDDEIVDEIFSIHLGLWVVSTHLTWCAYQVAIHPIVQKKLIDETKNILGIREPYAEDLSVLPYSQMVLEESLRFYPASWGYPHYTEDAMKIDDYFIPAKSFVIPMVYHTHRHPQWWPNPEMFDPERFHPDNKAKMHPFMHYPLGGGPRVCLGINLAPVIMRLIITMVFQRYRLEFKSRFSLDPIEEFSFGFHPHDELRVTAHHIALN